LKTKNKKSTTHERNEENTMERKEVGKRKVRMSREGVKVFGWEI
jgi:hypothetical protein